MQLFINELSSHEKTQRKLTCILLSERSKCEKAEYCIIPAIGFPGKGEFMKTLNRSLATTGWTKGVQIKSRETFFGLKRVMYTDWY